MKRIAPLVALAVVALVYLGLNARHPAPVPKTVRGPLPPWSQFGGSAQRTGQGAGHGAVGKVKWTLKAGNTVEGSPAVGRNGFIYVWSSDGILHAIDGKTDQERWATDTLNYSTMQVLLRRQLYVTGAMHFASPSPAVGLDGTICIGSLSGNVQAIR